MTAPPGGPLPENLPYRYGRRWAILAVGVAAGAAAAAMAVLVFTISKPASPEIEAPTPARTLQEPPSDGGPAARQDAGGVAIEHAAGHRMSQHRGIIGPSEQGAPR